MNKTIATQRDRDLVSVFNSLEESKKVFDFNYVSFVSELGKANELRIHKPLGFSSFKEYANDRFGGTELGSTAIREALRVWRQTGKSHGRNTTAVLRDAMELGGNKRSVVAELSKYDTTGQAAKLKKIVKQSGTVKDLSRALKDNFDKVNPKRGRKSREILRSGSLDVSYTAEDKKTVVNAVTLASMNAGDNENYWGMTPERRGKHLAFICQKFLDKN